MANLELAIRFTEDMYATKNDVCKELKMTLIDNIWSNILSYRSNFNHYLNIKSVDKNQFVLCCCSTVNTESNNANAKLLKLMGDYLKLNDVNNEKTFFENKSLSKILNIIALKNSLNVDEIYIRSIINKELKTISLENEMLKRYLDALKYIKEKHSSPIDIDFLADLYSIITGNSELTYFYRNQDDQSFKNRALLETLYSSAPSMYIESMMNQLFIFISSSHLNSILKAGIVFFYFNYVQPFNDYNQELAVLLSKAILSHDGIGELTILLPFESLLNNSKEISKIFEEVQRNNDITYFTNYFIKNMNEIIEELENEIFANNIKSIKNDLYQEENANEQLSFNDEKKNDTNIEKDNENVSFQKSEISNNSPEQLAVSYIPPQIDEKEAIRLENHLLESDPSLKRSEAKFFARHCVMGKRYTIQQFKKYIGCVYETARYSMDHLVEMGYYRKEMIKNKNVYTPIKR